MMPVKLTLGLKYRLHSKIKRKLNCQVWKGAKDKDGYGRFVVKGKIVNPARLQYAFWAHPIDTVIDIHSIPILGKACRRRDCLNPEHFLLGCPTPRK